MNLLCQADLAAIRSPAIDERTLIYLPIQTNQPATDHALATHWAVETVLHPRVLYLDTETTGLGADAEIVDLAVVDQDGTVLLDSLIRPERPIPLEATRIHGITNDMVMDAPRWPEVSAQLARLIYHPETYLVVYNAPFDCAMVEQANRCHAQPYLDVRWNCAMQAYGAYAGEINPRYGSYRWHRLADAAKALGVSVPQSHRALADAQTCRAVVRAMAGVYE